MVDRSSTFFLQLQVIRAFSQIPCPRWIRRCIVCVLLALVWIFFGAALGRSITYSIFSRTSSQNFTLPEVENTNDASLLNKVKSNLPQSQSMIFKPHSNSTILRGILLFYPNDQNHIFQHELRWFFLSWTEMIRYEPKNWRTDLIIYTDEYSTVFKELQCLLNEIRSNIHETPKCRVFLYVRMKSRTSSHKASSQYQIVNEKVSKQVHEHLKNYGYIDSINTVFEYKNSYEMYHYIIRTDMDCFLTKNFASYVPIRNLFLVGSGGYSTGFNTKRLSRISRDLNWKNAALTGLGSTWYSSPLSMHVAANYTIQAMLHLTKEEFTTPEREQRLGVMMWPEWHYGVLLLYGGHLALNHLVESKQFQIGVANQLLDQGVTNKRQDDIQKHVRLHLHCWHGDEPFSKFAFIAGDYNQMKIEPLLNDSSAYGIAMRTALRSKSMTNKELSESLLKAKKLD